MRCGERGRAQADPSARRERGRPRSAAPERPSLDQNHLAAGAVSEHKVRRNVSSYRNDADVATLEARVRDLVVARKMDREIARALNADGLLSAHGRSAAVRSICYANVGISPTVKINRTEHNPRQWPDGTYSVQGAAEALSISTQTVFKWLQKGRLSGHQITKGMPWQINLSNPQIVELRTQVRRTTPSKKEAS
jgi:hypothetical protein